MSISAVHFVCYPAGAIFLKKIFYPLIPAPGEVPGCPPNPGFFVTADDGSAQEQVYNY
jgi:hypothetical protein